MTDIYEGGCLCGSVSYRIEGAPKIVGDCYCVDCRKSSGTSHCTHVAFAGDTLELTGALSTYDHRADSGNIVTRSFCPTCGSPILSTNSGMPGFSFIRASSLSDLDKVEPAMAVYASRAPKWAQIDPTKPCFETIPEGGPKSVIQDAQES